MEKHMTRNIKDLITEYPGIKTMLDDFQIGCAACNMGTCRLADIVDIHNLDRDREYHLIQRLGSIIYPSGPFDMPSLKDRSAAKTTAAKFSPPMRELVVEHALIKRLLALIPAIARHLQSAKTSDMDLVVQCTDFITQYADRFHHAKEEDILFGYFDTGMDMIQVMYKDHQEGRALVRTVKSDLSEGGDKSRIPGNIIAYGKLLSGHIDKEDHILYPWMDRNLSTGQVGELFAKFRETNGRFAGVQEKYEQLINQLESQFKEV